MESNICHFVPYHKDYHSLHTISFVLETKPQPLKPLHAEAVCKMYYVRTGSGKLHSAGRVDALVAGDVFFTFPACPFCIESDSDFSYMYISFTGLRGNMLLEYMKISKTAYLFPECGEVQPFWETAMEYPSQLSGFMSEAVLLYTFSFLGRQLEQGSVGEKKSRTVELIKKYVDDHFTETDFSLESISNALSYNKKYISSTFKRAMKIGIVDYVNAVRIQSACKMLEQGFTSIRDVALQCGYQDAQYFSKVFKSRMGISPETYKKELNER